MEASILKGRQRGSAPARRPSLGDLASALQHADPRVAANRLLALTAEALSADYCAWYSGTELLLKPIDCAGAVDTVLSEFGLDGLGLKGLRDGLDQGKVVQLSKAEAPRNARKFFNDLRCPAIAVASIYSAGHRCGILLAALNRDPLSRSELELFRGSAALLGGLATRAAEHQRLREAQAKLSTIMRSSAEYAILTTDEGLRIVEQNVTASALFGRDGTGLDVSDLVGARSFSPRNFGKLRREVQKRGSWESDLEVGGGGFRAGSKAETQPAKTLHLVATALRVEDNELPGGYLIFARDVTEARQRERRLLDSQRMESVGLLAGGIAHDFNNILMGILGYASLAQDLVENDHPAQRMLSTIEQSAERAASLTAQLMAYCRGGKLTTAPIDVDNLLDETLSMLGSSLPPQVSVRRTNRGASSNVLGDPTQLQQVLMNLCLNAAEAIVERINQQPAGKGQGEISITVRDTQLRNQTEIFGANNEPLSGRFVLVQVKDNGTGMTESTLRRIFEPFFTTKFTGRGLGLAAVIGIIQNHGGGLHVTSKPGHGSVFSVYLPGTRRYAAPLDEQAPALSLEGSERVLIIDDEAVARQLDFLTLINLGYQVDLAASGEEGLDVYRQHQDEIDLVILDLTMPGMGGHEVLAELAMMDKPAAVLLTSGYDENMAGQRAGNRDTTGFLQKPYTPEVLAKAVREVLDKSK